MRYFKAILEYDGTNYNGWQRQINTSMTIQEKIEDALTVITKKHISVVAASRTDAGVHAYGQVIGFKLENNIPTERIPIAVNSLLPKDIRMKDIEEVDPDFHPRFHAKGKIYQYLIETGPIQSVFRRNYAYHVPQNLNLEGMQKAAQYLIGKHDFSSFRASGCSAKSPVRNLKRIEIFQEKDLLRLEFEGEGFLYNMVRILTGTLIYVGLGKFTPYKVKEILEARDRTLAGPTAPAHGLYLMKVFY
ncbi:tRNA pseudouridine(38,39,40) synthase TruA [Anoxybacter fermentans]|uniref:tRNA pseudouridine synthase A n=1 Tax=Anoxybacter fermentans TaxID=1323375 RepID=A0A3Q9HSS7_9FIRM|nr:tRNA pseudouridine(38-40) synthase TruA [Anoxybacter fermentans]AZR74750.1 tRNA pseudouridine(38,39,40) synthase TruA [Anoxybacter fermentans]